MPRILLHLEGAVVLLASGYFYFAHGGHWLLFVALLLAPDFGMIGYLFSPRLGSTTYNAVHIYLWPALLIALSIALSAPLLMQLALIWSAHIGMDRMLGYGLKYPTAFKDTHLQRV